MNESKWSGRLPEILPLHHRRYMTMPLAWERVILSNLQVFSRCTGIMCQC
ncbi:MAG TPA: hypothetical protein VFP95_06095 [Gammaproteobacteria bacterium]|nr:hypothetical protein [Gammaproteobacteria bacterium]